MSGAHEDEVLGKRVFTALLLILFAALGALSVVYLLQDVAPMVAGFEGPTHFVRTAEGGGQ